MRSLRENHVGPGSGSAVLLHIDMEWISTENLAGQKKSQDISRRRATDAYCCKSIK
jgi:hypothetical protein